MHLGLGEGLLALFPRRRVNLRGTFRILVAQGRLDHLQIVGPLSCLLLQTHLIWTNELFELDFVLGLDWDAFAHEKLALPDEIDVVGRLALPVDLLVANHMHLLHRILQLVIEPFRRPVAEKGQHFPEGIFYVLVLVFDFLYKLQIVLLHQRFHRAFGTRADGCARAPEILPVTLLDTPLAE